jgi:hypothetical protein
MLHCAKQRETAMSEAHEKTRIRQLEDAAAHWEHKYANARQYNRNLEARIAQLEVALRGVIDTTDWDDTVEKAEAIDAAKAVLGSSAENGPKP